MYCKERERDREDTKVGFIPYIYLKQHRNLIKTSQKVSLPKKNVQKETDTKHYTENYSLSNTNQIKI